MIFFFICLTVEARVIGEIKLSSVLFCIQCFDAVG